jgi:hypothetical protein
MITRFFFEGGLRRFSFDYLGPPWVFSALVVILIVLLSLKLLSTLDSNQMKAKK